MLVALSHNAVPAEAREDERDVLRQAAVVDEAVRQLGHTCRWIPVTLDLASFINTLDQLQPAIVFNLIESLAGSDRVAALAAAVIEQSGFPFTGSGSDALWLSNHKTLAKQRLAAAGLPTPRWYEPHPAPGAGVPATRPGEEPQVADDLRSGEQFIIKPIFEHASMGMDETAIVAPRDGNELSHLIRSRSAALGKPCFAEAYIAGREFNVSLLADAQGCEVLPLAEIDFSGFPAGKPRIVDYEAKWDPQSFAFRHTPRRFLTDDAEPGLQLELRRLARRCWAEFQLRGYVRVDFRIDETGRPWILELNTNPCLSPDAGYQAALQQAGIPFAQAIHRILQDGLRTGTRGRADGPSVSGPAPAASPPPTAAGNTPPPATPSGPLPAGNVAWRDQVSATDPPRVRDLVAATGFFYPEEVAVAEELVSERLAKGKCSGYEFVFAESAGEMLGYACYGPIACTRDSFDLYWIAVHPRWQQAGLGKRILREAEHRIKHLGGRQVYIETSNRAQYASTRAFYARCGYELAATLPNFYGPHDDKVIYVRCLA